MKLVRLPARVATAGLMLLASVAAWPQVGGGVPVRIPVGPTSQCINGSTDRVWLTMYRIIVTKRRGFLTSETRAQVALNVHVVTDPAANQQLTYPLAARVDIEAYPTGQVSLPVEYTLISGLPLVQRDSSGTEVAYTGFAVNTTLVNLRARNGLGTALDALQQITSSGKIPIPNSPYTQAAGYLLDFANNAVAADINAKNADDKYTTAALALNIDPTGTCADDGAVGQGFERTGVKAILMATGVASNELIPIGATDQYCWSAQTTPTFVIKAARKMGATPCSDPAYSANYKAITNDYVAFLLQRRPIVAPGHLGPPTQREIAQRRADAAAQAHSRELCVALGVATCSAAE